jgi:hypothetical protein
MFEKESAVQTVTLLEHWARGLGCALSILNVRRSGNDRHSVRSMRVVFVTAGYLLHDIYDALLSHNVAGMDKYRMTQVSEDS